LLELVRARAAGLRGFLGSVTSLAPSPKR
jgi:hypothetical protein